MAGVEEQLENAMAAGAADLLRNLFVDKVGEAERRRNTHAVARPGVSYHQQEGPTELAVVVNNNNEVEDNNDLPTADNETEILVNQEEQQENHDADEEDVSSSTTYCSTNNNKDGTNNDKEEEDEDMSVCVDDNGVPLVNGVRMKHGVPFTGVTSLLADPALYSATKQFTNGSLRYDLDKFVKEVVKTNSYASTRIFAVLMLWHSGSKRNQQRQHFFRDSYFSQKVFSEELGIPFVNYLGIRGWAVSRKKNGKIDIIYRRLRDCLTIFQDQPDVVQKYFQLIAMLDRVDKYIHSPNAFCPDELMPLPGENDQIKDAVVREEKEGKKKARRVTIFGGVQAKNLIVDVHHSDHHQVSAVNRHRVEHQYLQLALLTIQVSFGPIMSRAKRDSQGHLEKIFGFVFKECSSRRQFLEGLQDLLMFCKDDATIQDHKTLLQSWLKTPSNILTLARPTTNTAIVQTQGYAQYLSQCLDTKFCKSSIAHTTRSIDRTRVVLQVLVYMHLRSLNEKNDNKKDPKCAMETSPTTDSRKRRRQESNTLRDNGTTTTSISTSSIPQKTILPIPVHVVEFIAAIPSLLAAPPARLARQEEEELEEVVNARSGTITAATTNVPQPHNVLAASSMNENDVTVGPTWSIPYDSPSRWDKEMITVATIAQMRAVTARLVIECPDYDVWLHHTPLELYVAWDLHNIFHLFDVRPKDHTEPMSSVPLIRTIVNIPDAGNLHVVKPYLVVARPGCSIFDYFFTPEVFKIDLCILAQFIFKHGSTDPRRSTVSSQLLSIPVVGSRFDFGNAGQAAQPGLAYFRPKTLCNTRPLADDENGEVIRAILGVIVDAMHQCSRHLSEANGCRSAVLNRRRFDEFASELRNFLYAKHSVVEWITLQLLNLSHLQGGVRHKDVSNDPREGYNQTMCLGLHFTDAIGDLWSLKVIAGYRKKIGDYMGGPFSKLLGFKAQCVLHRTLIDDGYKAILGGYKGSFIARKPPSWEDPTLFFLDDYMPFEVKTLTGGRKLEVLTMISGSTRSVWLSPALTGCRLLINESCLSTVREIIQMAAMAACQNSFEHYYVVTQEMNKRHAELWESTRDPPEFDRYPMLTYIDVALHLFGDSAEISYFTGVFGSDARKKVVDLLVDELDSLIKAVNEMDENELCSLTIQQLLTTTSNRITERVSGCPLHPFRLLVFLQFCTHLNVGVTEGRKVRNMFFPLQGGDFYDRIRNNGFVESQVDEICLFLQSELSTPGRPVFMDEIENMLHVASRVQRGYKDAIFIKGQSLFRLDEQGIPWVKVYNAKTDWCRITPFSPLL